MLSELASNPERVIAALEAKLKLAKGQLSSEEDVKRLIVWYDTQSAIEFMNAVPKTAYCNLAARQNKFLHDQAAAWGMPLHPNNSVNVPAMLQWFHQFVATWGSKIKSGKIEQDRATELAARKVEAQLEKINVEMEGMRIDLEKKRGDSVPLAEIRKAFVWLSNEWRRFGERLGKRYGPEAQQTLNDFMARLEKDAANNFPPSTLVDSSANAE